jgi:hypothetical protein
MDSSGFEIVNRLRAGVRSRRWVVKFAAVFASALAMPRMSAAHPTGHQMEEAAGTFGRGDVTFGEEDGAIVINVNGKPVDLVARVQAAPDTEPLPSATFGPDDEARMASPVAEPVVAVAYRSSIFPFRTFDSLDEILSALMDKEGELWVPDR